MNTLLVAVLFTVAAFGQTTTGTISEWHTIMPASVLRSLPIPSALLIKTDLLQVFVRCDRSDANQFNVTVTYELDGRTRTETQRVARQAPGMTLVVFPVPAPDLKVRVTVEAVQAEVREMAVFE